METNNTKIKYREITYLWLFCLFLFVVLMFGMKWVSISERGGIKSFGRWKLFGLFFVGMKQMWGEVEVELC
jgi:hypothetical protein